MNSRNQGNTGIQHDGGYAQFAIAKASRLVSVLDELDSVAVALLLSAGLTTFSALCNARVKADDLVAVLGLGALGHLGASTRVTWIFEVAAIARGAAVGSPEKETDHGSRRINGIWKTVRGSRMPRRTGAAKAWR